MPEGPENWAKAWGAFSESLPESKPDALVNLFVNLDAIGSSDSVPAGSAALDELLRENRFEQAAFVTRVLATELGNLERYEEAALVLEATLEHSLWISELEVGLLYFVQGRIFTGLADLAKAEVTLELAESILDPINTLFRGYALKELAEVRVELGQTHSAVQSFASAIDCLEEAGEAASVGHAKRRIGEVLADTGQLMMAEKYLRDSRAILIFSELHDEAGRAELALSRVMIALDEHEEAEELLNKLTSIKREGSTQAVLAEASYLLAQIQNDQRGKALSNREVNDLVALLMSNGLFGLAESARGGFHLRAKDC